jgi:hypothetical protein
MIAYGMLAIRFWAIKTNPRWLALETVSPWYTRWGSCRLTNRRSTLALAATLAMVTVLLLVTLANGVVHAVLKILG